MRRRWDWSMKAGRQTTLRDQAVVARHWRSFRAAGHADPASGRSRHRHRVRALPASNGSREREIRADVRAVTATEFATVLGDASGPLVSTAEHVLAALRGLGVDNAIVEIDGPEVPIMDGSAAPFVAAIDQAGIVTLRCRGATSRFSSRSASPWTTRSARLRPHRARLPRRGRDRLRPSADRPAGACARRQAGHLPPRTRARPHLRLHARRGEALERAATRSAPRSRIRSSSPTTACSIRKACAFPTSSSATRRSTRSAIWRSPGAAARRLPLGARRPQAQPCGAVGADGRSSAWTLVEGEAVRPGRGHAEVGRSAWWLPAYGPDVS